VCACHVDSRLEKESHKKKPTRPCFTITVKVSSTRSQTTPSPPSLGGFLFPRCSLYMCTCRYHDDDDDDDDDDNDDDGWWWLVVVVHTGCGMQDAPIHKTHHNLGRRDRRDETGDGKRRRRRRRRRALCCAVCCEM
jgi:hypothetical protein